MIWGLPNSVVLNEKKNRDIAQLWGHGYVDIIHTDGHIKLAGYLAKYLSKGYFDSRFIDQRNYSCSRNVGRPTVLKSKSQVSFACDEWEIVIGGDKSLEYHKQYGTKYLGLCDYYKYKI